ncbi:hypothetical protein L798_13817 [Zootermopsis nevadensis]|uniref:Uncharacterized protein n=1 Tax=Zootermopsis nevadensis TaxID=136037 RepID=A0A067QRF7_ZOONE|nr:hypothetical protein L798_13817 [Zootermopsis nevadensis]
MPLFCKHVVDVLPILNSIWSLQQMHMDDLPIKEDISQNDTAHSDSYFPTPSSAPTCCQHGKQSAEPCAYY